MKKILIEFVLVGLIAGGAGSLWDVLHESLREHGGEYFAGILMFCVSALTGLQAALLSKRKLTAARTLGMMLRQGLLGLAVGAIWRAWWPTMPVWMPLGLAILLGMSETISTDALLGALLRALNLKIGGGGKDDQ